MVGAEYARKVAWRLPTPSGSRGTSRMPPQAVLAWTFVWNADHLEGMPAERWSGGASLRRASGLQVH